MLESYNIIKHAEGSSEKAENSSKCVFVLISVLRPSKNSYYSSCLFSYTAGTKEQVLRSPQINKIGGPLAFKKIMLLTLCWY